MLRNLLERCGFLIGVVTPDQDLMDAAAAVRESLTEWQEEMRKHNEEDEQRRPPEPLRRVK